MEQGLGEVLVAIEPGAHQEALEAQFALLPALQVTLIQPDRFVAKLSEAPQRWIALLLVDRPRRLRGRGYLSLSAFITAVRAIQPEVPCLVQLGRGRNEALAALQAGACACLPYGSPPEVIALQLERSVVAQRNNRRVSPDQIKVLHNVATTICAAGDLEQTLNAICQAAIELFAVDHSGLVFFDEDYTEGRVVAEFPPMAVLGNRFPIGDVSAQQALVHQRTPIIIHDLNTTDRATLGPVYEILQHMRVGSIMIVPISYGDRVLGSFSLDLIGRRRPFNPESLELCQIFAAQAAVAIAKMRQFDLVRQHTVTLTAQLDEQSLLDQTVTAAARLLQARDAAIYLYEEDCAGLRMVANLAHPEVRVGRVLPLGQGLAGQLAHSGVPYMLIQDYPNWAGRSPDEHAEGSFEAVLAVRLSQGDEHLGVLLVEDQAGHRFTPADSHLLRIFADQAALALLNAEKLRQLRQLTEASALILGNLNGPPLPERLQQITQIAAAILRAEASAILLVSEPGALRLVAGYGLHATDIKLGTTFAISDDPLSGLTGFIAAQGKPFRAHGRRLISHYAARREMTRHAAPPCHSLMVLPLVRRHGAAHELIGLIRLENKKDRLGRSAPTLGFSEEDETLLQLLAEIVVVAVENATLAERWQCLIDSSPSGVIVNDLRGRIASFSAPAQELLGYSPEEVIDQHVRLLFAQPDEDRKIGRQLHEAQGTLRHYETSLRRRDHSEVPVHLSAAWLYDAQGCRTGTIGYFEDRRPLVARQDEMQQLLNITDQLLQHSTQVLRISDRLQQVTEPAHVLQVLLAGLTAHDGLRLRRALVFDYDSTHQALVGRYALAHDHAPATLDNFIAQLPATTLNPPALARQVANLHLSANEPGLTPLFAALQSGHWAELDQAAISNLPEALHACLGPEPYLLLAPLVTADSPVGLLLTTIEPGGEVLRQGQCALVAALAATAALAVANTRLLATVRTSEQRLHFLLEASATMVATDEPRKLLGAIVGHIRDAVEARWVSLFLIDEGILRDRISTSNEHEPIRLPERAFRSNGISIQVMQQQQPRFIENVDAHRHELNSFLFREKVRAVACLPFVLRGEAIGVIWVHYSQPRMITPSECDALRLFVNQAAVVYENARRREFLSRMREASEALVAAQGWEQACRLIARHAGAVLDANKCIIWAYDHDQECFLPQQSFAEGIAPALMEELRGLAPRSGGTSQRAFANSPIMVRSRDGSHHDPLVGEGVFQLLQRTDSACCQIIGLSHGGRHMGVLYVLYAEPRRLGQADREQSLIFGEYAAQAMEQARRNEATNTAYSTANQVNTILVASTDSRPALEQIARGLLKVFECDTVSIYRYDQARDWVDQQPVRMGLRSPRPMNRPIGRNENPVLKWALQAPGAQFIGDLNDESWLRRSNFARQEAIQALAAAPLRIGEEPVGVLFISYRQPRRFGDADADTLGNFAHQAAIAIRNHQLLNDHTQRASALAALHQAAFVITRAENPTALYATIVKRAVKLFQQRTHEDCFAHYAEVQGHTLEFRAAYPPIHLDGLRTNLGHIDLQAPRPGITGRSVIEQRTMNIPNVKLHPDYIEYRSDVRSELVVPVKRGSECVGVINLESPHYGAFSAYDEYVAETLAQYVVAAMERYNLSAQRDQVTRQLEQIQQGRDLARRILSEGHSELETFIRTTCEIIRDGRDTYIVTVRLYDEQRKVLILDPTWSESYQAITPPEEHGIVHQALGEGICGWVALHDQPYCIHDTTLPADPDQPHFINLSTKNVSIRSEICVPIRYADDQHPYPLGVIDVQSTQPYAFPADFEQTLSQIAEMLAPTIAQKWAHERKVTADSAVMLNMGVRGLLSQHSLVGNLATIRQQMARLRRRQAKGIIDREADNALLHEIYSLAEQVLNEPESPMLTPDEQGAVQLVSLLTDLQKQVSRSQGRERVHCELEVQAAPHVAVRANHVWFQDMLRLLISNAIQATRNRDERIIRLEARLFRGGRYVEIAISDNGEGISKETAKGLFHERVQSSKGLGMGAFLARLIAETYGGHIRIADPGPLTTRVVLIFPVLQEATTQ
ncbi:MAG: GAF domain-containing protein [Oscillochloridaceae bacterium umkhey_bin13]